ncbi:sortase, partial [Adlercreutzia mucosicola]
AAEQAAAEAAARTRESAPVNETSSTPPPTFTNTLYFHGEYVPFVQGNPADMTAPKARVASTWIGEGDVDDDENTYFIGHNPGVFSGVMNLQVGDEIVVWDSTGASRSYFVFDTLVLPNASNYFAYEGRLSPRGESITLQTCVADDQNVRCVMAH